MSTVPSNSFVSALPPDFVWDEPNFLQYCYFLPKDLHDRLVELTQNASLALTIGSAEWILARFAPFDSAPEARDFVAACWAEMSNDWRTDWYYPPDEDWCGPVRGPILIAMTVLYDIVGGRDENSVIADRAVWMHNLACHVIKPLAPYLDWHGGVIERLESSHGWNVEGGRKPGLFDPEFPRGKPVSPEVLDLGEKYEPADAAINLDRFVQRERRNGNPYVLDPSERPDHDGHQH